jgi:hypothetical protein
MPLKRPQSLSDSFAYHALNIEKTNDFSIQYIEKKPKHWNAFLVRYALRFLFHILLIGLFETLFFFYYVSQKENSALQNDVNVFLSQITNECQNFTLQEKQLLNDLINLVVNASSIRREAFEDEMRRNQQNQSLFLQAWMYEVGVGGLFLMTIAYSKIQTIRIRWNRIFLENIVLIVLLGLYEYAFFSSIVYQYRPISTTELESSALQKIEDVC